MRNLLSFGIPHKIHGTGIYLHLVDFYGFHVGKYSIPMDPSWLHVPSVLY